MDLISGLRKSPAEGVATHPDFCLETPMDRGTCWAIVHGFAELDTTMIHTDIYIYQYKKKAKFL